MAKNPLERAKTGSPAGVVADPRTAPSVSPGQQSTTRAMQRAVSATAGKGTLSRLGGTLSQRQFMQQQMAERGRLEAESGVARQALEEAETAYAQMEPFQEQTFGRSRPEFDRQAVTRVMPMLLTLTALGGKFTKINALGMMKALDSGIKGIQEGNERAYKQALFDYQQNYKEFQERQEVARRQYDLLREAKKDGIAAAKSRYERSRAAVDDLNKSTTDDFNLATTFESNARDVIKFNKDMRLLDAQIAETEAKAAEKSAEGKGLKLTADMINKTIQGADLLGTFDLALNAMELRPKSFSPGINMAFVTSPKLAELGALTGFGDIDQQAIADQQLWRAGLNFQVLINAGMSQTVAEMNNQLAAFGSATLEARRAGMMGAKLRLLEGLRNRSLANRDLRQHVEGVLGKTIDEAIAETSAKYQGLANQARLQSKPSAASKGEEITQSEYDEMVRRGVTPAQIKAEGYYVRGKR